jgi:uncharacterized membrane protein YhhN
VFAFLGLGLAAAALQGYVIRLGRIPNTLSGGLVRVLLVAAAVYLAVPVPQLGGLVMPQAIAAGLALAFAALALLYWLNRTSGRMT